MHNVRHAICNSRTNPAYPVCGQYFSINTMAEKNHKKPHHPSKVQSMNYLTAKACGRWLPLLSITLQGCTSFRHLTFHSVHCHPPASATLARMLPSFHCTQANPQFHSAPLWLFSPQPETQSQNEKLHSTQSHSLHCIQSPPLLFPTQLAVCPAIMFTPKNPKFQSFLNVLAV